MERDNLKLLLPYSGTILIIIGYLKLKVYYSYFGLNILNYLELSELLTQFLPDFLNYLLTYIVIIFFVFLLPKKNKSSNIEDTLLSSNWKTRIKSYIASWFSILGLISLIIVLGFIIFLWVNHDFFVIKYLLWLVLTMFLFLILGQESIYKYFKIFKKYPRLDYLFILISTITLTILSILSGLFESRMVLRYHHKNVTIFTHKKKVITTDKDIILIGQTNKYLFLYDKEMKLSKVYKREEINDFQVLNYDKFDLE